MATFAQGMQLRDPLSEKLAPEHIDTLLKIAEKQDAHDFEIKKLEQYQRTRVVATLSILAGLVLLLIFGICRFFLHYGKVDQIYQFLALLFVGGGGIGVGTGLKRVTRPSSSKR